MGNCCFKAEPEPSVTGQRGAGASGQAAGGGDPGGGGGGKPPLPKSKRGLNKEQQSALNALYQEGLIECEVSDSNIRGSGPDESAGKCAHGRGMCQVAHAPQNGTRGSSSNKPRHAREWQPEFNRTASIIGSLLSAPFAFPFTCVHGNRQWQCMHCPALTTWCQRSRRWRCFDRAAPSSPMWAGRCVQDRL